MKHYVKLISLLLSVLMLLMCLASCGGTTETESETAGETSGTTETEKVETEDPRLSVKDDIPEGLSFANATDNKVTFFVRNDNELWGYEMDIDEITDNTMWDAIYERNKTVESRLGVEITSIGQLGAWGPHTQWFQTLRNSVNTKSGDFDTASIYTSQGASLAVEGMYYNLTDFPNLSLEKPWWNQTIADESALFDVLFFLSGDIALSETWGGKCMFFNKNLFEKYYGAQGINLYDMVEAGEWTIDELYDLSSAVWEDTNSNGTIDNGDTVGINVYTVDTDGTSFRDSWLPALGINPTEMKDGFPILTLYNERSIEAFEKLQKLTIHNEGALIGRSSPESSFVAGKALFDPASLGSGDGFRDMTDPYGVIPLPKLNKEQANYGTAPDNGVSLVVVLSSCFSDKTEMVGATLELMAAESYRHVTPTFYEVVLKSKFSNDVRDADMYDLILQSFVYTFGFIYSAQLSGGASGGITLFRNLSADFAQRYESNEEKYETALETLIDKLDELSYTLQSAQ